MHWKCTDSVITPYPYIWPLDGINDTCSNFLSDDGEAAVWSQIGRSHDGSWSCLVCAYSTHHKTNMFQHVEAKHVQTEGYHCPLCQKFCPNSKSLKNHKSRCPNKSPRVIVWAAFGVDFLASHIYHSYLLHSIHLSDLWSLICCISATTIAHSVQDREFADSLIRSKLGMNPETRLWYCKYIQPPQTRCYEEACWRPAYGDSV